MTGIARVGVDTAGNVIIGDLAPTVFVDGSPIVVLGATVTGHGLAPHDSPTMSSGSSTVFANGIAVCRAGDLATCGHTASGSSDVFAG
jgi:uncharacterized Zn-binding protein involved in type VI secretion